MITGLLILSSLLQLSSGQSCSGRDWFGPSCNFQCHCLDICNMTTGECIGDMGCEMGYFGPSCQYYSVAFKGTATQLNSERNPSFAVDGNDTTCSATRPIFNPLWTVTFSDPAWVVWTEILFPRNQGTEEIDVFLAYGNETARICNASMAWITSTLLRVTCKEAYNATSLSIQGTNSKQVRLQLCEVYVSGGRNIAVKKPTNQSSHYSLLPKPYGSSLAVDGKTSADFDKDSCTHTAHNGINCSGSGTKDPWWNVNLDNNYLLYRVKVFNRLNFGDRLTDFQLEVGRSPADVASVIYRDSAKPAKKVTSVQMPVNQTADNLEVRLRGDCRMLTLCEVQVFGDCLDLRYGLACDSICSCRDPSEVCNKIDGRCLSGCADGVTGIDCKQGCPPGTFGRACSRTCSENCVEGVCSNLDGTCNCQPGWKGDNCTVRCPPGYFGRACSRTCSENCVDGVCSNLDGTCNCQPGWKGDNCTIPCDREHYGEKCIGVCSLRHCEGGSTCSPSTGQCVGGCQTGWSGPDCTVSSGGMSAGVPVGAGAAVFVVLVLVIVTVIVVRKKRSGRNLPNSGSVYYITASNRERTRDGSGDSYPNSGNVQHPDAENTVSTTINSENLQDRGNEDSRDTDVYEVPLMYNTYEDLNTTTCEREYSAVYTGLECTDSEKQKPEYQNC